MEKTAILVIVWRLVYLCTLLGIGGVQLYVGVRYGSECWQGSVPVFEDVLAAIGTAVDLTGRGIVTLLMAVVHIIHILLDETGACQKHFLSWYLLSLDGSLIIVLATWYIFGFSLWRIAVYYDAPVWSEFCLLVHSRTIELWLFHSTLVPVIFCIINILVCCLYYDPKQISDRNNTQSSVRSNTQSGIQNNVQSNAHINAQRRADINIQSNTQRSVPFIQYSKGKTLGGKPECEILILSTPD